VVMVMGALGRCGGGAVDCATRAGLEVIKWDKEETAKGGPFPEILTDCDVFVNCILLQVRQGVGLHLMHQVDSDLWCW